MVNELNLIANPTSRGGIVALKKVEEILMSEKSYLGFDEIKTSTQFSKVSIVGSGMVNNPGVASVMFEALYDANINIHMISTSETKISVLVNVANAEKAVQAIHDKFLI